MEFKLRAIDKQPPSMYPPPQSSGFSYFPEQAIRAGSYNTDMGRNREFFGNQFDVRETIRRELEKERIREEIIAAEIASKRALVEEVRMEMMIEREMAMRRGESFSYPPEASRFDSRHSVVHQSQAVTSLEERIAFSLEERFGRFTGGRRIGGIEPLQFHRNVEPTITMVKHSPLVREDKVIPLGMSNTNLGAKRKALTPPKVVPCGHLMEKAKKPKEEWSCAICEVSATSEHLLNEHLKGKKHKAKEAALRAEKEGRNFGIGLIPKEKMSSKPQERDPQSNQKVKNITPAKGKKEMSENDNVETNGEDGSKKKYTKQVTRCTSSYKLWCEMCEIGANNEKVMEDHKMGKKHQYRLKKLDKGVCAEVLAAQSVDDNRKLNETVRKECPEEMAKRGIDAVFDKKVKRSGAGQCNSLGKFDGEGV